MFSHFPVQVAVSTINTIDIVGKYFLPKVNMINRLTRSKQTNLPVEDTFLLQKDAECS